MSDSSTQSSQENPNQGSILNWLQSELTDSSSNDNSEVEPPIPPLKKQDFTLQQLKKYDGTGEHGRVLLGVNGKVYDMTKGRQFYGPGGPYSSFAGRDASRGLATFQVEDIRDEYDDLSDLKTSEMDQMREWDIQFSEKYPYVGKLLKPGEEPTSYSDEETDEEDIATNSDNKKTN